ncbi:hypothetical protein TWF481_004944 [Arthrobotrys musiformis]|uniref:Uncharacterized protein n=1 Tax=Arthrobotrys musiformis TaxID=47236 RepID=A0AAV9WL57_9PEZI
MKFFTTVLVAVLSVTAMAAPAQDLEASTLEKRGCPAGVICISGKCRYWYCNQSGCSVGPATGQGC